MMSVKMEKFLLYLRKPKKLPGIETAAITNDTSVRINIMMINLVIRWSKYAPRILRCLLKTYFFF